MTFYTGREARNYDVKFKVITKHFIKTKEINAKNPNKAQSEAFRCMVDKMYDWIKNDYIPIKKQSIKIKDVE